MAPPEPFPMHAARCGDVHKINQWRTSTRTRVVGETLANPIDAKFRFEEWRPLQLAAAEGDLVALGALLTCGADATCAAAPSLLPAHAAVHVAARYGHAGAVRALVEAGADVDSRDSFGFTPLHYAASNGHLRTVEELVSLGADAGARSTRTEATAAALARLEGHGKIADVLEAKAFTVAQQADKSALRDWLSSIGCDEYFSKIIAAGYDFQYIAQHGFAQDDVDALGIPPAKMGHAKKLLAKFNFPKAATDAPPADESGGDEDGSEEEEDDESGDEDGSEEDSEEESEA
ncbi:ankyrin repeat-containing domain protein [Pelagophyceae sp. CCMP2097]|nr:ankyrin repeat-containing domain protein [Pelagophyceae sp. CCMP2097]